MSKTFRQELTNYYFDLQKTDWLQGQLNKLKSELRLNAAIICNHPDACPETTMLVRPRPEEDSKLEPFSVYILNSDDWSIQDATKNLKLEPVIEIE